jgi:hypothetical protein
MGNSSKSSIRTRTALAAAVVLTLGLSACTPSGSPPPAPLTGLPTAASTTAQTSAPKENSAAVDYSRLLIRPADINTPTDTFSIRSAVPNRRGGKGVSALFVNQDDTKAVGVTITILPDPAAAKAALDASVAAIGATVAGGTPQPAPVGTDGTVISGTSPDGAKDMTVLVFTEGPAVARMDFGSAPGNPTPPEIVHDVGVKQDIALRGGLQSLSR